MEEELLDSSDSNHSILVPGKPVLVGFFAVKTLVGLGQVESHFSFC